MTFWPVMYFAPGDERNTTGTNPAATIRPTASTSSDAESCKLLTQAEVEAAVTQTQLPPQGTSGEVAECRYVNAGGFGLTVDISTAPTIEADYEAHKAKRGKNVKDLTGIGDKAFEVTNQRILEFIKGKTLVSLYTEEGIDVVTEDEFHALARTAASRIP
jgi:hypothetical protein